jgi:membrane fusion protein (multidrug efflux system)
MIVSGVAVQHPAKILTVALLMLASACGGSQGKERERPTPLVKAEPARISQFVETIDAVGTARANEQVTLSAPVTERIVRLNFDDGAYVTRGQTIAVLAAGQETAQLQEAQARAREAQQQLNRIAELKERGFATVSNLDQQVAAAAQARAQAAEARASIGDRIIWVSLRNISAGAVVNQGSEIVTISDISSIKLDFTVPETLLPAIQPGQAIEARSAAYPDQPFRGQIASIDPVIDPNTRAVMVRARLPNPDRKLKPGMLLNVAIQGSPRTSLSVPELSVIGEGDQRFVYRLDNDIARRVPVRTGLRSAGRIEVVEGLRPGQQVVTEGVVKLSDGMKVRLPGRPGGAPTASASAGGAGG